MSESKHTPGPWTSDEIDGQFRIYGGIFPGAKRATVDVADVWGIEKAEDQQIANAALICAAPDLLAALKRLSFAAQISGGTAGRDEALVAAIDQAAAAISRATGADT